jgi:alpha-mannosidase
MKNYLLLMILFVLAFGKLGAQDNKLIVNGFSKYIAGTEEEEDCSCTLDATVAMTARCVDDKQYIEWETDPVPGSFDGKKVSFIWSAGYSTGDQQESRSFSLYCNDKFLLSFITASRITGEDWKVENESAELSYKNVKTYNRSGNKKDFWGYFILTVPMEELSNSRALKIKIKGDASGSRHWYRAMQYKLLPKIKVHNEKLVAIDETGKQIQRVKISIDHYALPQPVEIFTDNEKVVSANLNLGSNDFYVLYDAVKSPVEKTIEIETNGQSIQKQVILKPVKNITFYILAHSHVDIGYTDLQPEIEKKQWKNIDEAIKLAEQSSGNPNGSAFKWNVEVLWAVKSYLEKFPEKRDQFFYAVKKGWIGLDATYANLLTGLCRPEELYRWLDYSNQLEKEAGVKIESAMISDVPGYTWGTVQAFADNGIKNFSVGTNESDRIGNSLKTWGDKPFYWKSPSGKNKILVWLAGKGYSWFHHWSLTKDDISPLLKYIDDLERQNYPYNMVQLRYTIGDNGGPDPLLPDFIKKWNETHITPQFKLTTTTAMFKDFEKEYKSKIPVYKGDFTPYWEDGAASSAKETALNRNTAELLNQLETLYTLNGSKDFPRKDFDEAWKNVLLYSEHTWGAYNSISEPGAQNVKDQWRTKSSFALKADSIAKKLLNNYQFAEDKKKHTVESINVWNINSWKRSDVVTIPSKIKTAGEYLIDESGKQIFTQRLTNGDIVFIAKDVLPLSSKQFYFVKEDPGQLKPFVMELDQNKWISSVLTREIDAYVDKNSLYGLNGFIHTEKNAVDPRTNGIPQIIPKEKGPVVNSVVFESTAPGCNKLSREIRTFTGLNKKELINTIDKKKIYEKENIRFAFPFDIEKPVTRIDIAWTVIKPEIDQLTGANKNYFSVQRWFDVSNDKRGITVATIDAPFIELGGMNAEAWMSSAQNKWNMETESSAKVFSWVINNSWHTNYKAEQEGVVTFKYALLPHKEFDYSAAYRFGVEQSQPLMVTFANRPGKNEVLIHLDENSSVVLTSLKPSWDGKGFIARLYNPANRGTTTTVKSGKNHSVIYLSNGDEKETKQINNKIVLAPFEVKTVKIFLNK